MADGISLEFRPGRSKLILPDGAINIIVSRMANATRQGLLQWEAEATRRTPVGVSGRLRANFTNRIEVARPLAVVGILRNDTPYALPVEEGARPHFPPYGPGSDLARWAERKLGDASLAFVVARSIARGTTRGTAIRGVHMAREALRVTTPAIRSLWRNTWRSVTRELSR